MKLKLTSFALLFSVAGWGADPIKMCQVDVSTNAIIASACFTVPAEIVDSFDKYIATQYTIVNSQKIYAHSSFLDLVVKHFINTLVGPILDIYPTADLKTLKDAANAAQAAVDEAKAASLLKE